MSRTYRYRTGDARREAMDDHRASVTQWELEAPSAFLSANGAQCANLSCKAQASIVEQDQPLCFTCFCVVRNR